MMKLFEAIKKTASSNHQQLQAYYALQRARQLVAASLLSGRREFHDAISRMKQDIIKRNKGKDGKVYDLIDVQSLEQKQILWVSATTKQLKTLAEYEAQMLSIVSNRGMVPDEATIEAGEFIIPYE